MHWDARLGCLQMGQIIHHVQIFSGSKDCVRGEVKRAFNQDLKSDVCSKEWISRGRAFHRGQTRTKYNSQKVQVRTTLRQMSSPVEPRRVEVCEKTGLYQRYQDVFHLWYIGRERGGLNIQEKTREEKGWVLGGAVCSQDPGHVEYNVWLVVALPPGCASS